jgi:hypothetical protein
LELDPTSWGFSPTRLLPLRHQPQAPGLVCVCDQLAVNWDSHDPLLRLDVLLDSSQSSGKHSTYIYLL